MIAVDWGTTNRRAYALDSMGRVTRRFTDARGVLAVEAANFPAAVAELRSEVGNLSMFLAGMVGSNRGWVEVPYVQCPASVETILDGLVHVTDEDAVIVPGVIQPGDEPDVMRGEEVQFLGAVAAGLASPETGACHPGTHAKWARMSGGAITGFRTVMTGELFALLRRHSILSPQLDTPVTAGDAFRSGVRRSLDRAELSADLFGVRARGLTGALADAEASSYASGLLIGADVRVGLTFLQHTQPVALIGDAKLTALYAAALEVAGCSSREIDGETAFLAGIKAIAERMR
jgi:2-dehydro-3-deoxygalactonokinase